MESLIYKLEDTYTRINKAFANFKKSPKDRITRPYVKVRLESLEKLWDQYSDGHNKLYEEYDPDKLKLCSYVEKDMYDVTEEVYIQYKTELETILESFDVPEVSQKESSSVKNSVKQCHVKLPKIVIPVFSGKYTDWVTFRDLFLSLIHHNTSLDNVQRMQYLKGYLSGEAEQLLRQIPISDANYERCWEQLNARYNNKRYLSHFILKRLLSQRNLNNESAVGLKELIDNTNDCLEALSNLGIDVSSWDIIVIHIITLKLDAESRKQWELKVTSDNSSDTLPTYDQFKDFLTSRYRALEFLDAGSNTNRVRQSEKPKVFHVSAMLCKFCNESHKIISCKKFVKTDVNARREFIEQNGLCFNCLGYNHSARQCLSSASCRVCKRKHHSLLHPGSNIDDSSQDTKNSINVPRSDDRDTTIEQKYQSATSSGSLNSDTVASHFASNNIKNHQQVLLATALVNATARNGMSHTIRALLDQGSQASFVTEATAQYLGLKKTPVKGLISGLEGRTNVISKFMVEIILTSIHDPKIKVPVVAYVLKTITTFLPCKKMVSVDWTVDLPLADPQYNTPNKIDILLGAEVYGQVIQEGMKKSPQGALVAQATLFGWILSGVGKTSHQTHGNVIVMHSYVEENDLLKRFWEIEEDSVNKGRILNEEEKQCERFFADTTSRDKDGRYIVRLPFKTTSPELKIKNSKKIAEKRVNSLVVRLSKNEEMKTRYQKVLDEYLLLEHMEKVPETESNTSRGIYLPHFAVVKEDKDTTQVRIVFDASCKGENGISLNDLLMVGPTLQPTLRHILLKWRLYPICLSADIVKMYRQIKVAEQDIDFQRIVWKEDTDSQINEYRLLRVTFGTACAPYLAVKVLQQVASDEKDTFPKAAKRVKEDFYMDDLLTGVETVEEGLNLFNEMNGLVEKGGFCLQKWSSNCGELLERIKQSNEEYKEERKFKIDETMKLLGLTWNRTYDAFRYTVTLPPTKEPVTKRIIISDISRLFDPLGWVSPSVIVAKIIIQKLWLSGIGWDDEVPSKILKEWFTYREDLHQLSEIKIPRWITTKRNDELVELHGFCDASKSAYAAVVYVRVINDMGVVTVNLVTAKTKVAPIKQISIPRLELCGAVLLSRLLVDVANIMEIRKENIHAWTDSTVVLAWLNSHPNRWQTFVANRVSEILTTLDAQQWSHVRSGLNPADYASRGLNPSELKKQTSWFDGPAFLCASEVIYDKPTNLDIDLEAVKVHFSSTEDNFWNRFSSLTKLIRVVAYCRRMWIKRNKDKGEITEALSTQELKDALDICIRKCQAESFEEEMEKLVKEGNLVKLKGSCKYLNPFIDGNKILRVGGRLQKSDISESRKHPILLPKKSILTNLIVADAHCKTLHGGPQLMLAYLRSKYWILGAKELVKSHVHKCVTCVRHSAATSSQLMGQLPAARVTPTRPFKCSGVDYAGPINIRSSKGRGHHAYKGYICLFVCMVTKAVHIEAVSDLTTQGFLAAFRRFTSRRGYCSDIWSDNGTNFVGASKELKKRFSAAKSSLSKELADCLASQGTKWHFIPPYSPNFGGLWEAGIKSIKFHLRRVIGDSTLTYEELSTVLAQIEACLNSRPLSRMDNDLDGLDALTPGHFLVGEPLVAIPEYNFESSSMSSLRRWQLTQRMMQSFWRRWSQEYLTMFLHRYKWNQQTPEPNIGDLVLVKEDDLPPSRWLLGRVVVKHSGLDGITRVLSLRTKNGIIKRSLSKVCVLPVMST